jgi:hypothetical protein
MGSAWMDHMDDAIAVRDAVPLVMYPYAYDRRSDVRIMILTCGECLDSLAVCAGDDRTPTACVMYLN